LVCVTWRKFWASRADEQKHTQQWDDPASIGPLVGNIEVEFLQAGRQPLKMGPFPHKEWVRRIMDLQRRFPSVQAISMA
jgi:hypothetical protein